MRSESSAFPLSPVQLNDEFGLYYGTYLGITEASRLQAKIGDIILICSNNRNHIYNNCVSYLAVGAMINSQIILSVAEGLYEETRELIHKFGANKNYTASKETITDILAEIYKPFLPKTLLRFSVPKNYKPEANTSVPLEHNMKDMFMASLSVDKSTSQKLDKWLSIEKFCEEGCAFVSIHNDKIVSVAQVSDITLGSGNIVVNTIAGQRNKGHGKQVVNAAIVWCLQNKLLPIYTTHSNNLASIGLAQSIKLSLCAEEIVIASYIS